MLSLGTVSICSVAQLCPTLCNPMDCSPPDSSVHGMRLNLGLLHFRQVLYHLNHREAQTGYYFMAERNVYPALEMVSVCLLACSSFEVLFI